MAEYLRRRLIVLATGLVVVAVALGLRLLSVQVAQGAEMRERARQERVHRLVVPEPPRGQIYDRDGFLLTVNELRYSIEANPPFVDDATATGERLAPILHVPAGTLTTLLEGELSWLCLQPYATMEEGEAVQQLGLEGVSARRRWIRQYPQDELLAHVLGFVSRDGQGFYGLEGYYEGTLHGWVPDWMGETGPSARWPLPHEEGGVDSPLAGTDLVLTLDLGVQALAQEALDWGIREYGAQGGTIIVMDPRTGAILAMVERPSFDPNRYERIIYGEQEELFQSVAYGAQYEPGSVFKIITMAAALNSGLITSDTTYVDAGRIEYGGRAFANWDGNAYGERDMVDLLGYSLNVGAVWLSTQMGADTFYQYVRAFGFGQLSGADLQGEASGWVRVPGDLEWHDSDLGTNSFGQGLAVTPLQMISAVAAVANEGRLMRPYLVDRQVLPDGAVIESQPMVRGQPISAETAATLTEMLALVVDERLSQVQVPGYRIAGKTGTAQIPVPGGYDPRWTIGSFVGFGPVDDPQLAFLVRLDRPQTSQWGSQTATRVFQRLAAQVFPLMGIPPDG